MSGAASDEPGAGLGRRRRHRRLKTAAVQRICKRLGDRPLVLDEQHGDHVWIGPVHTETITTMAAPRKASIKD